MAKAVGEEYVDSVGRGATWHLQSCMALCCPLVRCAAHTHIHMAVLRLALPHNLLL